jgi:hypothetical protein
VQCIDSCFIKDKVSKLATVGDRPSGESVLLPQFMFHGLFQVAVRQLGMLIRMTICELEVHGSCELNWHVNLDHLLYNLFFSRNLCFYNAF